METLKVIVVDDNEPFRNAIKRLLTKEYNAEIIGEASNGAEFLALTNHHLASVILMDVMMPEIDGVTLAKRVLWLNPHLKIIAITMHVDKVYLATLVAAGFKGCVFKNMLFEELGTAIQKVIEGNLYFPKNITLTD